MAAQQKQGKASAHGEPLGVDNVKAMKEFLGWPSQEPFYVPEEVYDNYKALAAEGAKLKKLGTYFLLITVQNIQNAKLYGINSSVKLMHKLS